MSVLGYFSKIRPNHNLARSIKSLVKVSKDSYKLAIDVKNYSKDDIRITAGPNHVTIMGKHKKKTENSTFVKQFTRKYSLPSGVDQQTMKSVLSHDGILTLSASRQFCREKLPFVTEVPILSSKPVQNSE